MSTEPDNRPVTDPIRALVVDDEKLARSGLRAMLRGDPDLVVRECSGGQDAIEILRGSTVDLVLLDVQMPNINGFDVIAAVGVESMPVVVFTTAYSDYAIEAFEACALDYLLKPIGEARLAWAIARAKERIRQRRRGEVGAQLLGLLERHIGTQRKSASPHSRERTESSAPRPRFQLRSGDATYFVDANDVDWIEADGYYARLWTGGRSHLLRESLTQLETKLDAATFVRVHRSAIVNVSRAKEIRRIGIGRHVVVLGNGRQIPLSRDRRARLESALRLR